VTCTVSTELRDRNGVVTPTGASMPIANGKEGEGVGEVKPEAKATIGEFCERYNCI